MGAEEPKDDVAVFDKGVENSVDVVTDTEGQQKKLPYPKAIGFIVGNEFCERFNYYGMRTILVIYLNRILFYSKDTATVIYHVFTMLVYLFCVVGAIIADSWLGKFRTIVYLSIIYVIGSVIISLGAMPPLNLPGIAMTILGLALIAFGSGGIKPCVSAFGGDQFKLPEQAKQMATFFSIFYFAINSGSLISTTVTPLLREDVHCFGNAHCFSLAFGVPAVLMAVSIVIFVIGLPLYVSKPAAGNTFVLVSKAIGNGIVTKYRERKTNPREHFLDYAIPKYGKQLTSDIKVLLRVLVLYIPIPIFWALFDQQGSRWTFQATQMDGLIGTLDVKPEQMQLVNPLFILILIPCYDFVFYPLLAKIGISRPLQKLTIGGILAGIAFILSAIVELTVEPTNGIQPSHGLSQLRIFNGIPNCNYTVKTDIPKYAEFSLPTFSPHFEEFYVDVSKKQKFNAELIPSSGCSPFSGILELESGKAISYFITGDSANVDVVRYQDETEKSEQGYGLVRVLPTISTTQMYFKSNLNSKQEFNYTELVGLPPTDYELIIGQTVAWKYTARPGDIFTLIVTEGSAGSAYKVESIRLVPANSVKIFWQIPQYFILTLGEVMFSVTGLEFSYAQAPNSMKAVLQACWQLAVGIGNLIVVIIAAVKIFDSQAYEFFLFAGLMFADMILFMFLAMRYIPNDPNKESIEAEPEESGKKGVINPSFHED